MADQTHTSHVGLSPEQMELLAYLMAEEGLESEQQQIPSRDPGGEVPLSFAQERLWFLDQWEPGNPAYNIPIAVRLSGQLDVDALEWSLNAVIERHEVLRTTFPLVGDRPVQRIAPALRLTLPPIELPPLTPEAHMAEVLRQAAVEVQARFDLQHGPLLLARLLRLSPTEHVFLMVVHHIVIDGWSLGIFIGELSQLYAARIAARDNPPPLDELLPPLPIQYADFAVWQRQWLQNDVREAQIRYWQAQLHGPLPILQIPTDRARPPVQTWHGAVEPLLLPAELIDRLSAIAQQEDATLFMVLLSAFGALLQRYSGQSDLVIGSPAANRDLVQIENLIGFFVNTLALRVDLSGQPTFRELLRRTRAMTLGAYEHASMPFEQLVDVLRPERDLSHSPIFQAMFSLQSEPLPSYTLPGLALTWLPLESTIAKFDLTLSLEQPLADTGASSNDRHLTGTLEYNTDLFDAATIQGMVRHLMTLLHAISRNPDQRVVDLPLLPDHELQPLAAQTTAPILPDDALCLHQLIEQQAALTPNAIALVHGDQQLSYAELDRRANQLAHYLRGLGVGPERRVGLLFERSIEQIVGLVGVLKAGGAYVPLDPGYPQERLALVIEDAAIGVLLTQTSLRDRLPQSHAGPIQVCLDRDWPAISQQPTEPPAIDLSLDNLVYLIYTSGSSGKPKGVMITHAAIVGYLAAARATYALHTGDRVLQFASLSFDASAEEIFPCLTSGGTLVLRTEQMLASAGRFFDFCRAWELTVLDLPTAYWHELCAQLGAEQVVLPSMLRLMIIGGERALPERLAQWQNWAGTQVRLVNTYGPSETTIVATAWEPHDPIDLRREVPIGVGLPTVQTYVLDQQLRPQPPGVAGELCIGGVQLARGYLDRPDLTAEKFIPDTFSGNSGARLYRTGDRVRVRADGNLEFLGRIDQQVKVRGFRIELGEIEAALAEYPAVREAVVVAHTDPTGDTRLTAYVVTSADQTELHSFLQRRLPGHMVPSALVLLAALPRTTSGKIDRRALPAPEQQPTAETAVVLPNTPLEQALAEIWQQVLGHEQVSIFDNFFDLGGHSLRLIQVQSQLRTRLQRDVPLLQLFRHPTIRDLALSLDQAVSEDPDESQVIDVPRVREADENIVIIGINGTFPGAATIEQLWQNLMDGVDGIRFFSDDELRAAGVAETMLSHPGYVKARGTLDTIEWFDAQFFGYNAREASLIDPQQRLFLECCWTALERAGYPPGQRAVPVGVFAGSGMNTYQLKLLEQPALLATIGQEAAVLANEKDYLATRTSYKLNLRGPSLTVQTACSTSLVAVHLACQSLRQGECTIALAGGTALPVPQAGGYLYEEGGILSPDGHCRAFDAEAQGTVGGSGVAVVVLKRLSDALADGDQIYAVIKGSAINNDGANKVGYTAPSVDGQAEVITNALRMAQIAPETVGFVEAHGTGTRLGDPIEVAALKQAFGRHDQRDPWCALGAIKTNLGHLDAAAGVTGLIKAALALQQEQIPPTLHYTRPNPALEIEQSPFYVNTTPIAWPAGSTPRRAGVSSFGIGGTNAHVVLEEAPPLAPSSPGRPYQLLVLSAKTPTALEQATDDLAARLARDPALALADVAFTLQVGRRAFAYRRAIVCRDSADAATALAARTPQRIMDGVHESGARPVIFMFPGQGTQYVNMARGLYESEPQFRATIDQCAALLEPHLDLDLRQILYPEPEQTESTTALDQSWLMQPALFVIEYALAQLWLSWGVKPQVMIGHSLGEYVAATLAGVFTLEDALQVVALRGRLMQQTQPGAMVSVPLGEADLRGLLGEHLDLAAINGPALSVVSGPRDAIAALERTLAARGLETRRLHTDVANHSALVDGAASELARALATIPLHAPCIRYISNVTGTWITAAQATDPAYWAQHMRQPVQFAAGLETLLADPAPLLLELGPAQSLSSLARRQIGFKPSHLALPSLRRANQTIADAELLQQTLGRLWLTGVPTEWSRLYAHERRRRVLLPTYPFERQRYWIDTLAPDLVAAPPASAASDPADWFYVPSWQRSTPPRLLNHEAVPPQSRLILADQAGIGAQLGRRLAEAGQQVVIVQGGDEFRYEGERSYTLDPRHAEHYQILLDMLSASGHRPEQIVHLWSLTSGQQHAAATIAAEGYTSLILLAQALGASPTPVTLHVVSHNGYAVTGGDGDTLAQAVLRGPCQVIPLEMPQIACRQIDVVLPETARQRNTLVEQLAAELSQNAAEPIVIYRGGWRWTEQIAALHLEDQPGRPSRLREQGVYLITGGLEPTGTALAQILAEAAHARLVLVGPYTLPPRDEWTAWLDDSDGDGAQIRRHIAAITALEAAGAEVLVASADPGDLDQMRAVVTQAEAHFGAIHGLIQAVAPPPPASIAASPPALDSDQIRAALVLETLSRTLPLDLVLLCSNLHALWPGQGNMAAGSAHALLAALVQRLRNQQDLAAGVLMWAEELPQSAIGSAFRRLLWYDLPEIIIATQRPTPSVRQPAAEAATSPAPSAVPLHTRPALPTAYVAPRNDVERRVAETWQELLGITPVGVYDNFFDLGGHSLLATQMLSRLRETFHQDLPLRDVFEANTVADLAALIVQHEAEQVDQDQLAALLGEIQQLTPEQVASLLLADHLEREDLHD